MEKKRKVIRRIPAFGTLPYQWGTRLNTRYIAENRRGDWSTLQKREFGGTFPRIWGS